jgi:prenyltransferase beta subunit/predicted phosphodiesterase
MPSAIQVTEMIRSCVSWIWECQNSDGGLPSDKEGSTSCTWTTSGLLWACWTAGEGFTAFDMQKALTWVLDNVNGDYGIPLVVRGDYSVADATAQTAIAGSLALISVNDSRIRAGIEGCVKWLLFHRLRGAGWNWRQSDEPAWVASTAFAILGLSLASAAFPALRTDITKCIIDAIGWLMQVQNPDGGWGAYVGDRSRPAITGLVVSTLAEINPKVDNRAAISFIIRAQQPDGQWADTVDRPTGHTVTRIGVANCMRALANCGHPLDSPEAIAGFRALLGAFDERRFRYRDTDMLSWPTRDYLLALTSIGCRLGTAGCRRLPLDSKEPRASSRPRSATKHERLVAGVQATPAGEGAGKVRMIQEMPALCRILHISDIHRGPNAPTSDFTLSNKLLDDINHTYAADNRRLAEGDPHLGQPDLIVVSGDLTQTASEQEYECSLRFIESLLPLVNGERRRVVLVPGNHDVNWAESSKSYSPATKEEYEKQSPPGEPYRQSVKRAYDGTYWKKSEASYTQRFRNFKILFDTFYGGASSYSLERGMMYTVYDYSKTIGVVVAGFNSCDEIDAYPDNGRPASLDRRAFINTDAIYGAVKMPDFHGGDDSILRLAVFHHNIRSVGHAEDFLDPKYLDILKLHRFDVCLHGHVHVASHDVFDPAQAKILPVVGAGSLAAPYTDRPPAAPMGYNLFVVDRRSGGIWAHTRRHDESHLTWMADYQPSGKPYFVVRSLR